MKNNYKHWRDIPQDVAKRRPIKRPVSITTLAINVWRNPTRVKVTA